MSSGRGDWVVGGALPASGGRTPAGAAAGGAPAAEAWRALRESEARYRGFFEESFDGMFISTPGGRFVDVNRKAVALFGYETKQEMLALELAPDVYADPAERQQFLARVDAEGTGASDVVAKRKGGERFIAHFAVTAERDASGAPRCYRCVVRDVTAERREEHVRDARLRLLEFAVHHTSDEILTATLDELEALTGSKIGFFHFLEADQQTLSMQAWSTNTLATMCRAQGKGSHYPLARAGVWADAVRERRAVVHDDYASLPGKKGMPEGHARVVREAVVPVFRGRLVQAVIGMGNKASEYDAGDLEVIARLGDLAWDIANRKRAEEALTRQHALLRSVVEGGEALVAAIDREGRYTLVNDAYAAATEALYGFCPAPGLSLLEALPEGPERERARSWVERGLAGERFTEEVVIGERGRDRCARVSVGPVRAGEGEVIGVALLGQDLTERRSLEEQLRQAQKLEAVGRLAGGVAHDFNNILAVINGCADLALDAIPAGDPAREDLVEIREAGQRAAVLTRQLLAFARKQVLQPVALSLNDVVAEAEKMLRRLVGEDIELHTRLASDLGTTVADPAEMEQVIINLAVNSRDAMPSGGRLTLETRNVELDDAYARTHPEVRPGAYVCLAVSDTGCGMDAETLSHVFDPFFTTKERGKGTGMGLPTVYGIVKQSGGSVGIYSEVGRGTTVRVYLPRKAGPADAADHHPRSVDELRGHETVLVVEDQPELRGVIERVLRGLGYRVLSAGSAEDALVVSRNEPGKVELLLTDVVMPGLGGPALVQALAGARPGLKVLYMSGYSDDAVVKHGILAREARFLAKPFGASALALAVRRALDEAPAAPR